MSLSPPPDAATYAACRQIIERSAYLSDIRDFAAYAELFTEHGRLTRPGGQPLAGRAAIVESYNGRPADRMTRHMVGHSVMETAGAGKVRAATTVLLWSTNTALPVEAFGRKADAKQSLGEYLDELILTPQGWRIAQRDASFIMYRE